MERTHPLTSFSDDDLLRRLSDLLGRSRRDEADLVAHIGEVDRRRLYAREASPSMFAYCTEVLHLSEAEAYLRIAAARAAREHPLLLTLLADGRLHLTAIAKLAPHLTPENREDSPEPRRPPVEARDRGARGGAFAPSGCSGGDAEAARPTGGDDVAGPPTRPGRRGAFSRTPSGGRCFGRSPTPSGRSGRARARTASRRSGAASRTASRPSRAARTASGAAALPALPGPGPRWSSPSPRPATRSSSPPPPSFTTSSSACGPSCAPLCPTATWLRSSSRPSPRSSRGSKRGASPGPRRRGRRSRRAQTSPTTRQIPAAVKRAVYERDGGRCRYEDEQGRRCTARQGLEFHHRRPFGHGGDHSVANIALACKCHNGYLAEVDYGREAMARHRRSETRPLEPTPSPSP